jgi:hypothetical protein
MDDSVFLANKDFWTDTITQCLTDDCKECTGSYSNHLLRHRLICRCRRCGYNNKHIALAEQESIDHNTSRINQDWNRGYIKK